MALSGAALYIENASKIKTCTETLQYYPAGLFVSSIDVNVHHQIHDCLQYIPGMFPMLAPLDRV